MSLSGRDNRFDRTVANIKLRKNYSTSFDLQFRRKKFSRFVRVKNKRLLYVGF